MKSMFVISMCLSMLTVGCYEEMDGGTWCHPLYSNPRPECYEIDSDGDGKVDAEDPCPFDKVRECGVGCSECKGATDWCTAAGQCVDDCAGRECGQSPNGSYDCGTCSGATDWCTAAGQCVDDCAGRVCGQSPNAGYDCGTCSGATDWCNSSGQCEDDCAGRECGSSPNVGHDCGTCYGATDWCTAAGQCEDDCAGRECGSSPNAGHDCGTCSGATDWCTAAGQCEDDCAGRECGSSPNAGHDCGTCSGATEACEVGQCVDECAVTECGPSPNGGFDCGTCSGATGYCVSGQCFTWQNPPADLMTWQDAMNYCNGLTQDGHSDWRLPTISELRSLIRGCPATETGGSCGVTDGCLSYSGCRNSDCDGCSSGGGPAGGCYWPDGMEGSCSLYWSSYWSSSEREDYYDYAWDVNFVSGNVSSSDKVAGDDFVRCVR